MSVLLSLNVFITFGQPEVLSSPPHLVLLFVMFLWQNDWAEIKNGVLVQLHTNRFKALGKVQLARCQI